MIRRVIQCFTMYNIYLSYYRPDKFNEQNMETIILTPSEMWKTIYLAIFTVVNV